MDTSENTNGTLGRIETIILKWIDGTSDENQNRELLHWLESSMENREHFASIIIARKAAATATSADTGPVRERIIARINARIDAEKENAGKKKRRFLRPAIFAAVAAAASAALLFLPLRQFMHSGADTDNFISYTNGSSDISAILLGDSTKVWLGPGSSMDYDVEGEQRTVLLKGNAYFDVHKDSLRPFIVRAGGLDVRVLGTSFCVESDEIAGKVSVVLERGSVRLQTPDGISLVRLVPDQKAEFETATGDVSVAPVNAAPFIVRHYNNITLEQVNINEILFHINEMYGIRAHCTGHADTTIRYNLSYRRTDSIGQVLKIVEELTGTGIETN
ncbi:MAG: FecR family protein [Candidatus Cryptobacteroides sp.]